MFTPWSPAASEPSGEHDMSPKSADTDKLCQGGNATASTDATDQSGEALATKVGKSAAPATMHILPSGSPSPVSPNVSGDMRLPGQWTQRLDELQRDVAAARVDLQEKHAPGTAGQPEHMHLVDRVAAWETGFRAVCIEAEAWHRRERETIHARSIDLQSSREVNCHRHEMQVHQNGLAEARAELHAAGSAKSELRLAKIEARELREEFLAKDAEYDAMSLTSKKQEAALEVARRELRSLNADNRNLSEGMHSETDAALEARAEFALMHVEARGFVFQIRAKDEEHEAMLLASKKQEWSLQSKSDELASVKEQLHQALERELQGERAREELTRRHSKATEALHQVQERSNAQEAAIKSLDAALVASAVTVATRDESIEQTEAKAMQMAEAVARSDAGAAGATKEMQRMQDLVLLSNASLSNAESKQADYASELSASRDLNEKLEERVSSLQAALASSMKNQLLSMKEAEGSRESRDLCISLQAKVQSLEATLAAREANWSQLANMGSLTARSVHSRDYPRNSHSEKLRTAVLSARTPNRITGPE